jgi:hypothetical protein
MCETLASADRDVSPTRFHNSVHNTASGYWGIATRSHEASTSICCYDASFVAGLIETVAQVADSGKPVALISYDQPYPEPLHSVRPLVASFAAALVLAPHAAQGSLAALDLAFIDGAAPGADVRSGLERSGSGPRPRERFLCSGRWRARLPKVSKWTFCQLGGCASR